MGYAWKKCTDPYQRIEAWKLSDDVYVFYKEGWFVDSKVNVSVRFLLANGEEVKDDLEMMIRTLDEDSFIKLNASYGTSTDNRVHIPGNLRVLRKIGLEQKDLLKANIRELCHSKGASYAGRFHEALERLCAKWFRGEGL